MDMFLLVLFFINISSIVVLFVGWLTHADYYYKLFKITEEPGIVCHSMITVFIAIAIGFIWFFEPNINVIRPGLIINAFYTIIITFAFFVYFLLKYLSGVRRYFAYKRGR